MASRALSNVATSSRCFTTSATVLAGGKGPKKTNGQYSNPSSRDRELMVVQTAGKKKMPGFGGGNSKNKVVMGPVSCLWCYKDTRLQTDEQRNPINLRNGFRPARSAGFRVVPICRQAGKSRSNARARSLRSRLAKRPYWPSRCMTMSKHGAYHGMPSAR